MPRVDKVKEALKEEIGTILQREIKDPRIGFITVTHVEMTPDLRFAKVYYSVMGTEKNMKSAHAGLQSCIGFIRKLIGQRLRLRYTPEIIFEYDDSLAYSQRISDVLEEIKEKEEKSKKERG